MLFRRALFHSQAQKAFPTTTDDDHHIQFTCTSPGCKSQNFDFKPEARLMKHIEACHIVKRVICAGCQRSFSCQDSLARHMKCGCRHDKTVCLTDLVRTYLDSVNQQFNGRKVCRKLVNLCFNPEFLSERSRECEDLSNNPPTLHATISLTSSPRPFPSNKPRPQDTKYKMCN